MKKHIFLLFASIWALAGCGQIGTPDLIEEDCVVSFNLVGDISTSDQPLTKASSDDLYYVQIFRGSNSFAFGVFDNTNFSFNLKSGSEKYRIIVGMVKNGKTHGGVAYDSQSNRVGQSGTSSTFWLNVNNSVYTNYSYYYYPVNQCYYNSFGTLKLYSSSGDAASFSSDGRYFANYKFAKTSSEYPSCDDWFYGEINDYSPMGEYETLNVELKRVGFQLKYEISGVTDGEVTVKVYNNSKTFIDNTTNTATYSSNPVFYAFKNAYDAWQYADDYMENFTLAVSWLRGIGITEDYGTKTIQLKRNCLNNIKINMGSNDQNAGMNLTVEAENTIGAENVTIPVQ